MGDTARRPNLSQPDSDGDARTILDIQPSGTCVFPGMPTETPKAAGATLAASWFARMNALNTDPASSNAPSAEDAAQAAHAMQCMEIWGGNTAVREYVRVTGIDAWLYSKPYRAAGEHADGLGTTGGDIHYISMCAAGHIARFVVADVSGHGAKVGAIAESLRKLMRRHVNTPNQAEFAKQLNSEFASSRNDGKFATALLASYWAQSDHLIVTNAGHPRPLWFSARTSRWSLLTPDENAAEAVPGVRNLPLGIIEPTEYEQFAVQLGVGDLVVIYTDALIEAADRDGNQLGEQGLLKLAEDCPKDDPRTFGEALLAKVEGTTGELMNDDVTLLVMHHNGSPTKRRSVGDMVKIAARFAGFMP